MSVHAAQGILKQATKDLFIRWEATRQVWHDQVSEQFAKTLLEPLEPRLKSTQAGLSHMAAVLERLRRECGPD